MWDGKNEFEWSQTSSIMCLMANINRDTKKRSKPFTPDDFKPSKTTKQRTVYPIETFRDVFVAGNVAPGNALRASKKRKIAKRREQEKGLRK